MSEIQNRVAEIRKARGLRASEVAEAIGVSRQTVYAIENGSYTPNTVVALRLARTLGGSVEDLFALPAETDARERSLDVDLLAPGVEGDAVRVCRVAQKWVAVRCNSLPEFLPDASAVLTATRGKQQCVQVLDEAALEQKHLLVAGCDPAIAFLVSAAAGTGIEVVPAPANSRTAIDWLKERRVHVAGSHLEDPRAGLEGGGSFNVSHVRKSLGKLDTVMVTYAGWEQGFVVAKGNPKKIRHASDLARPDVRFLNREQGAGARALLDRLLQEDGVRPKQVRGYNDTASGHLSAAMAVATDRADCCLATGSAAQAFRLDFVPLGAERYDFVFLKEDLDRTSIQILLDLLQRASLREKLRSLAGYDTSDTGKLVAK